jgi:hypothetical protein
MLLLSAGVLGLAVWGTVLLVRSLVDRGWKQMEAASDVIRKEVEARPKERPVLRGVALPGNAWDDYGPAVASFGQIDWWKPGWKDIQHYNGDAKDVDPLQVEEMISTHRFVFEALERGARRRCGAYPYAWEEGDFRKEPGSTGTSAVRNLALARARLLREEGHVREAVEALLDLAQFGRDLAQAAPSWNRLDGQSVLRDALEEFRLCLEQDQVDRELLKQLGSALEVLEGSLPEDRMFAPFDVMDLAYGYRASKDLDATFSRSGCMCFPDHTLTPWSSWRFGFSRRLMAVNAFGLARACAGASERAEGGGWSAYLRSKDEVTSLLQSSLNPLKHHGIHGGAPELYFGLKAQLRLLRVAACYRADGEIPDLEDPFGTRLKHRLTGSRLKLWSVGRNGRDDDGAGTWSFSSEKDIVLVVDR